MLYNILYDKFSNKQATKIRIKPFILKKALYNIL